MLKIKQILFSFEIWIDRMFIIFLHITLMYAPSKHTLYLNKWTSLYLNLTNFPISSLISQKYFRQNLYDHMFWQIIVIFLSTNFAELWTSDLLSPMLVLKLKQYVNFYLIVMIIWKNCYSINPSKKRCCNFHSEIFQLKHKFIIKIKGL